jgi:hypothetical protein
MKNEEEIIERMQTIHSRMLDITLSEKDYAMLSGRYGELQWVLGGIDRFDDRVVEHHKIGG